MFDLINIFALSIHVASLLHLPQVLHTHLPNFDPLNGLNMCSLCLLESDTVYSCRNLARCLMGSWQINSTARSRQVNAEVCKYLWIYLLEFSPDLLLYFPTNVTVNYILCTCVHICTYNKSVYDWLCVHIKVIIIPFQWKHVVFTYSYRCSIF
jgi:hypothetical protein